MKGVTKSIKNERKGRKGGLLGTVIRSMLLGTLGASLLGNMLVGKVMLRAGYENKEGKTIVRVGYGSSIKKML